VRGYNDRILGASSSGGGLFEALTNIEYGFKPVPPLKLHVFFDAGNTWTTLDDYERDKYLYKALGVGMLFTIPGSVIQIRLDWGFGLDHGTDPVTGEALASSHGRVHFNIGNIF
jgi:outer membrane protein assembly factor BamA